MVARSSAFCALLLLGCAGQGSLPAQPSNAMLTVRPNNGAYTYFDGFAAKAQAAQICASRGGVLNPAAFGQFAAGAWIFAGGCV